MPLPQQQLIRLLTAAFVAVSLVISFNWSVEAKGKKSRRAAGSSKSKSSSRQSARRSRAGRSKKARRIAAVESYNPEADPNYVIVPDRIEVIENGSSEAAFLSRSLMTPRSAATFASVDLTSAPRHRNVRIDSNRVIEIQQALTSRGYYRGEINGDYDEMTVDAMRRFQANERISATGYPTAHALRRLGLGSW